MVSSHFGPFRTTGECAFPVTATLTLTVLLRYKNGPVGDRTLRNQDISALVEGCACVITWIRLIQERHNINTYLCIIAIYAYLAITNQILNCVNSYVIRITNCQIRTLGHAKSRFFGAFNSLYSKVGRLASEEVILSLLQSKCLPILLYTTEVCPLLLRDRQSLEFTITRIFIKIYHTSSSAIVKDCQCNFNFLPIQSRIDGQQQDFCRGMLQVKTVCVHYLQQILQVIWGVLHSRSLL